MEATILIADDDASVRRMIARVLEMAGYRVVQAANWAETTAAHKEFDPSLLLLDLELLKPEHKSALAEMEMGTRVGRIPVIGLTAWPNQYARAGRWGLDIVMEKPLDLGCFLQVVYRLLARSRQPEARVEHGEPLRSGQCASTAPGPGT